MDHAVVRGIWPWLHKLLPLARVYTPWVLRQALHRRVRRAGPGFEKVAPEHIVAMQILGAVTATAAGALCLRFLVDASMPTVVCAALFAGALAGAWPLIYLRRMHMHRSAHILRELPFLLDMATLALGAGANLHGALQQVAQYGPEGPLRSELRHALADMRAGTARMIALHNMAQRCDVEAVHVLVQLVEQAEQMGMSMGPLFRAQAAQHRAERFLLAEKLALEAPVKMLFPLALCIFPCTFLVIAFPIAMRLIASGA
ncbi:type II secretion system F family protein [Allopusillimonas soli]|nr:type II secretion system F family protein [Allopusillimonas soli]